MTDGIKSIKDEISREEARLAELDQERDRLSGHIANLKDRLSSIEKTAKRGLPSLQTVLPSAPAPSTSAEKVALFMDLFRGRADVYPKRWVNTKKDTKGYSPACSNEWAHGLCDKRKVKCGDCPNQAFLPVTEKTIHDHFQGRHVIGVYPMLQDETCWFLAVDFDKGQWQDDVTAFTRTCHTKGVPHAVERSRSGNGAHVWFFFATPVSASTARKMGCYLITETMAGRHELPMTSYDRFFPNQDTMPRGGFGNLIALPFQDGPRQQGNSMFVDSTTWSPYPDQWAHLASVRRMKPTEVETLTNEAVKKGQVIGVRMGEPADDPDEATPWARPPSRRKPKPVITGPLPEGVNAVLSQMLFVEIEGLPSALINQIKRLAAFQNPEFYKKQALMPIIGYGAGLTVQEFIASFDHWVAFGLLVIIGGRMIVGAVRDNEEQVKDAEPTRGWSLVMLSVATSIDALAVGLSLAMLRVSVWFPALVIGIVAGLFTASGIHLGGYVGRRLSVARYASLIGGVVLLVIGGRILHEHGVF